MDNVIDDAFNYVEDISVQDPRGKINGLDYLDRVSSMQIGQGTNVFRGDESGIWLGAKIFADAPFSVSMAGALVASSATITGYSKNFTSTVTWTSTDIDTATWGAGTIKTSDGTSYSITGGNTGNIAATTYIYLDPSVSITVLQTTTTATSAIGSGKIPVAIVVAGAVGTTCSITVISGAGTIIDGGKITTNSIAAASIVTGSLEVGTNVGLGTAQDSSGVTTIIGNTVTTSFVNALSITALGAITAGSFAIGTNAWHVDSSGNMWWGSSSTYAGATIKISTAGSVDFTSGNFGGSISIGSGNSIFKADSNGIYLGNATFASAPFNVNMTGDVVMKSWTLKSPDGGASIYGVNSGPDSTGGGIVFPNTSGAYFFGTTGVRGTVSMNSSNQLRLININGQVSIGAGNGTSVYEGIAMNTNGFVTIGYGANINELSVTSGLTVGSINGGSGTLSISGHVEIASGKNLTFLGTQGSINCGSIDCNAIQMNSNALSGVSAINGSGTLDLNPGGTNKVKMGNNIDLNEKDLDAGQTLWAYNFSNRSDAAFKKNISSKYNNLDQILALRPVSFQLKRDKSGKKHFGFIAQEIQKVIPEAVVMDDKGMLGINYNELTSILIGAVQELKLLVK